MSVNFPLFHRTGSIVFLDDDLDFLEMMGAAMPSHLSVELFMRSSSFLERMRADAAGWQADMRQQELLIQNWRQGQWLLPQLLNYWASTPDRHRLVQACIVDYALPGGDGLKVLNALQDWPGSRILLSGHSDEQTAVQAFNGGLIDQFIGKQTHNIADRLQEALTRLAQLTSPRSAALWAAALSPRQQSLLRIPSVATAVREFAARRWVEYVVLGEPFGILGLDSDGGCQWLQLEFTALLPELADLAEAAGLGADAVRAVCSGLHLPALELHQQLAIQGPVKTAPAFVIDEDRLLTAALFSLGEEDIPRQLHSYREALEAQSHRTVKDV